jgi:hypothetical protein
VVAVSLFDATSRSYRPFYVLKSVEARP